MKLRAMEGTAIQTDRPLTFQNIFPMLTLTFAYIKV